LDVLLRCKYFLPDGTAVEIDKARLLNAMKKTTLFVDEQANPTSRSKFDDNDNTNAEATTATSSSSSTSTETKKMFVVVVEGDCGDVAVAMQKLFKSKVHVPNDFNSIR
jgi:hypothetical protein